LPAALKACRASTAFGIRSWPLHSTPSCSTTQHAAGQAARQSGEGVYSLAKHRQ
jgi:hypothetical protein